MSINFLDINGNLKTTCVHYSTYADEAIKLTLRRGTLYYEPVIDYYEQPGFTTSCKVFARFEPREQCERYEYPSYIDLPHVKVCIRPRRNKTPRARTPNKYKHGYRKNFYLAGWDSSKDFDIWLTFDFDN